MRFDDVGTDTERIRCLVDAENNDEFNMLFTPLDPVVHFLNGVNGLRIGDVDDKERKLCLENA